MRDQDITTQQHIAFARRFGELEVHPFAPEKPGYPEVLALTHDERSPGYENVWHSMSRGGSNRHSAGRSSPPTPRRPFHPEILTS